MQYNNPNGKWSESIPYMIINLEHERDVYLGKDTVVAYAREEDKSCNYLEINELAQLPDLKRDRPTTGRRHPGIRFSVFSSLSHRALTCRAEGSRNFWNKQGRNLRN